MGKDQNKRKPAEKKKWYRLAIGVFWVLVLTPFLGVAAMLLYAASSELPGFKELENPKTSLATEVLSADKKVLGKYFRENRTNVSYEDISPHLVHALVSTEDERFYQHCGIDFQALARVAYGLLIGERLGGGSTITQQLAKLLFHKRPTSIWERIPQKFKEWIIAVRLERQYTKKEIITMYLNNFDFLHNAVGIQSASHVYFNTTPDSMRVEQAAMLVGMAKNPALFNPRRFPDTTKHRREIVLHQMMRNGHITRGEYDSLRVLDLGLNYRQVDHKKGLAPYFREHLRGKLTELLSARDENGAYKIAKPNGEPYDIYSDGLKVYTTIDSRMQRHAEWAVKKHIRDELQPLFNEKLKNRSKAPFDYRISDEQVKKIMEAAMRRTDRYRKLKGNGVSMDSIRSVFNTPVDMKVFSWDGPIDTTMSPMDSIRYYKGFMRSGLMSMDPNTGFVKAWVGGINYDHFRYDHVAQSKRQVGSTFKPFVYATAMRNGYSPCHEVSNIQWCIDQPDKPDWCPENASDEYGGKLSLKYGLANSKNTITAWVMKQFGPEAVIKIARRLGIKSPLDTVPALGLGVADLSVREMTSAHASIVNKGVNIEPIIVTRIEDKHGNAIFRVRPETNEALDETTAYTMLNMMKGVVDGAYNRETGKRKGTGMRLRGSRPYAGISHPVAGKTGTSQHNSDGWFMGSTPDLVTGVWVGAEDRAVRFYETRLGQGANTALPIWGYYMNRIYDDERLDISTDDFEKPEEEISVELDCKAYFQKEQKEGTGSEGIW